MKGDFSRRTFDASRHYSAVLVEQGRLLTDADLEEEHRILEHRIEEETRDVLGGCGGPIDDAGFAITSPDGSGLEIGPGAYYVGGTLVVNDSEDPIPFTDQPDRFDVPWPLPEGRHVMLLDTWRRLITAHDDPAIREVALGGPTTSSRERVIWQVHAVAVTDSWTCGAPLPEQGGTSGLMAARAEPEEELTSPCLIPPQAGYTGLENQFYRVEVFATGDAYDVAAGAGSVAVAAAPDGASNQVTVADLGSLAVGDAVEVFRTGPGEDAIEATFAHIIEVDAGALTLTLSVGLPVFQPGDHPMLRPVDAAFVVSRDNGSVVTLIEAIDGAEVTVHDTGPDDALGFAIGQLVELSDDRTELESLPRQLHQIVDIDQTRRVIVLRVAATPLDPGPAGVDPDRHPKLRRWDAAGAIRFHPDGTGWIHLEHGNQVRFTAGGYRSGDHWQFPARAATVDAASGTIHWPQDGTAPALLPPIGIEHRRCPLAVVTIEAAGDHTVVTHVDDCRHEFPALTDLVTLLYVGGDGQEGSSADAADGVISLPGELEVRVANGGRPVVGTAVRFRITSGSGRLDGTASSIDVVTGADGLASCSWAIDTTEEHQVCDARLLDHAGEPVTHQLVRFHATIDRDVVGGGCCCVTIGGEGDFPTIREALGALLERGEHDLCLCLLPGDHLLERGDVFADRDQRPRRLSIQGCGRGTRVHLRERLILSGWLSLRLCDLDLLISPGASVEYLDVADVEIRGCRLSGLPEKVGLVRVYGGGRLQVTDSMFVGRRQDTFEGLRDLLEGMEVIAEPWEVEDEGKRFEAITNAARELAGLPADRRRSLADQLRDRIEESRSELSVVEHEAYRRVGEIIGRRPEPALIRPALEQLARAATVTRPGIALEIGSHENEGRVETPTRASIVIADNDVAGIISLYGLTDPESVVDEQTLGRLNVAVKQSVSFSGGGGDVHIRDNRLTRLALGHEMIELLRGLVQEPQRDIAVLSSLHVTDNVIDGSVHESVACHTTMTANHFTFGTRRLEEEHRDEMDVAHIIGDTATYTGNHARFHDPMMSVSARLRDVTRTSAEAANLELRID